MDTIERSLYGRLFEDLIAMYDAVPAHNDMFPGFTAVQVAVRAQMLHYGIERGIKALIENAGATPKTTHTLLDLLQQLANTDSVTSDHLEAAFHDVVGFYGYNPNQKGFKHLKTLPAYLSRVGGNREFERYRYWISEGDFESGGDLPPILLNVHRELLCCLAEMVYLERPQFVSQRVDRTIFRALDPQSHKMYYTDGVSDAEVLRRTQVQSYMKWLGSLRGEFRSILRDTVGPDFNVGDHEFVVQVVRVSVEELKKSEDPAVRYFMRRLEYLPEYSQPKAEGYEAEIDWIGDSNTVGAVKTPGGSILGYVRRYADGGWGIEPMNSGLMRTADIALKLVDAQRYLVNLFTVPIEYGSNNGEVKEARLCSEHEWFEELPTAQNGENLLRPRDFRLEFWDGEHGLNQGDGIIAKKETGEGLISVLEGVVTKVEGHTVLVAGSSCWCVEHEWRTRYGMGTTDASPEINPKIALT